MWAAAGRTNPTTFERGQGVPSQTHCLEYYRRAISRLTFDPHLREMLLIYLFLQEKRSLKHTKTNKKKNDRLNHGLFQTNPRTYEV